MLTAADLQRIGFNDPNVIASILNDPAQRAKYQRELGIIDPNNPDFEGEAQKAYNDLGAYYDRILSESKGDVNKAISRLVEDYDKGIRMKKEDVKVAKEQLGINQKNDEKSLVDNALSRGIYQKSAFGGPEYGIYDTALKENQGVYDRQNQAIDTGLSRYIDESTTNKERTTTDLTEAEKRREFDLEQQRRTEAANLANNRVSRALQRYDSTLI